MSMTVDEIIGVAQVMARPGVPLGARIENGAIVPLQRQARPSSEGYASFAEMAEVVKAQMDRWYGDDPNHPEQARRIYPNAEGVWVRVIGTHTGETYEQKDAQGKVVATFAARVWKERAVALTKDQATSSTEVPHDFFDRKLGWLRRGVKREREDVMNVGDQARQRVQWESIRNASPSPTSDHPAAVPLPSAPGLPGQLTATEAAGVDPTQFEEAPPPMQAPGKGK